jgi:hypothetical protein
MPSVSSHDCNHFIIIGRTALFEPQPFLEDSATLVSSRLCCRKLEHPVLHSFGYRMIFFFCRAKWSALRLSPNVEDQVSVFTSHSDMLAQLYP